MKEFEVCFIISKPFKVEAENEDDAENKAYLKLCEYYGADNVEYEEAEMEEIKG